METRGVKLILYPSFTLGYALFFSLGMCSLLELLGFVMSISLDGKPILEQYPRYVLFCIAVGVFSLIAMAFLFFLNLKASEKIKYNKLICILQSVCVLLISLPIVTFWQNLFGYLQKIF